LRRVTAQFRRIDPPIDRRIADPALSDTMVEPGRSEKDGKVRLSGPLLA